MVSANFLKASVLEQVSVSNGEVYVIGDLWSWVYRNSAWVVWPAPRVYLPACASIRLG